MNVTVTLPSTGKTVTLDVTYIAGSCGSYSEPPEPGEVEIHSGLSDEEIESLTEGDWLAIEDAAVAVLNDESYDEGDDGDDWWSGDDREPEIMGLDEYDRGW